MTELVSDKADKSRPLSKTFNFNGLIVGEVGDQIKKQNYMEYFTMTNPTTHS